MNTAAVSADYLVKPEIDRAASARAMKEYATAGVTLSMKNCFGITPATIYGTGAGIDEPSVEPKGGRTIVHAGDRQPSKSAPSGKDPSSPRKDTYRVPRTIVDLVSARHFDLAIVESIKTITVGEGPWNSMAERGTPPFERCDSTLSLAEGVGLGTRDMKRIEVTGTSVEKVKLDFAAIRRARRGVAA